jgi:hypothetical protein
MSCPRYYRKDLVPQRQTQSHGIPTVFYDPINKRSNIFVVKPKLDAYVQQYLPTLGDCISGVCAIINPPDIDNYVRAAIAVPAKQAANDAPNPPVIEEEADAGSLNLGENDDEHDLNGDEEYQLSEDGNL